MNYRIVVAAFAACCLLSFALSAQSNTHTSNSETIQWNSDTHKDYYVDANGDDVKDLLLIALNDSHTTKLIKGVKFNYETRYLQANLLTLPDNVIALLTAKKARILPGYFNRGSNEDLFVVTPKTQQAWLIRGSSQGLVSTRAFGEDDFPWLTKAKQMELYKGDFNGDNIDDLLVLATKKGKHFLYHTNEQGEFPLAQKFKNAVKWGLKRSERLYIGDFNNDGRDDIFALAKKRKKKNYIVYANKNGKLKAKHTVALKAKFTDYEWFADGFSTLVDEDDSGNVSLVRMYNANGGVNTEGQFAPEERDTLRFDKCKHLAFSPANKALKKKCRIKKKKRKQKQRQKAQQQKEQKQAAGFTSDKLTAASFSAPALAASEGATTSATDITPATPQSAPNSSIGAYPRINETFELTWESVPNTTRYELWVSQDRVNIDNTFLYTSGTSFTLKESTTGSRFYYIKACNQNNCSGLSPYRSIYVYNKPQPVEVFHASPVTVTSAQTITLEWLRPEGAIGTGAYYEIHEQRPNRSGTVHRVDGTSSDNLSYTFMLENVKGQFNYRIRVCNKTSAYCSAYSEYRAYVDFISSSSSMASLSNLRYGPIIGPIGTRQKFYFDYTNTTRCINNLGNTYIDSSRSTQPLSNTCPEADGTTFVDRSTNPPKLTGSYCWDVHRTEPTYFEFSVMCTNQQGGRDTASLWTLIRANTRPVAYNDFAASPRLVETGSNITLHLLNNDVDTDNHDLTITSYTQPTTGSVSCSATTCTYTAPTSPVFGNIKVPVSFRYTISDGWGGSSTATAYLSVFTSNTSSSGMSLTGTGYSPQTVKLGETQTFSFNYNNALECGNSLGNIYVPARSDGAPQTGTYSWSEQRTTPAIWDFTVYCTDGREQVSMDVRGVVQPNGLPNANNDEAQIVQYSSGIDLDVLENDTDPDNHSFFIESFAQAANGVVSQIDDATLRYQPNSGFFGIDTFTYTLTDEWGGTSTGTVTITVEEDQTGGLIAEYLFDDLANPGRDTSGKHNHATVTGSINPLAGVVGNAGNFAVGASLDNVAGFSADQFTTINFWVKPSQNMATDAALIQQGYWDDNANYFELIPTLNSGKVLAVKALGAQNGTTDSFTLTHNDLTDGNWHMITLVTDGTTTRLYVNGSDYGAVSDTGKSSLQHHNNWHSLQANSVRKIGGACLYGFNGCSANSAYTGLLDEYRMYARALSGTEIAQLYSAKDQTNNAPAGAITLIGDVELGATLTASHNISDADGLGDIEYQWYRDGVPIAGATEATYLLQQADIGAVITVTVSFLDGNRRFETVVSEQTDVIVEELAKISNLAVTPLSNIIGDSPALSFNYEATTRCYNKDVPTEVYYDGPQTSSSYSAVLEAHYVVESRVLTIVCENAESSTEAAINVDYQQIPAVNGLSTQ